jgi:hypothetical protein
MKPKEGDKVKVIDRLSSLGDESAPEIWIVIQAHDNLDESWDPFGESAWAQKDHDTETGQTGEWYVICKTGEWMDGTCSFASYEVESL